MTAKAPIIIVLFCRQENRSSRNDEGEKLPRAAVVRQALDNQGSAAGGNGTKKAPPASQPCSGGACLPVSGLLQLQAWEHFLQTPSNLSNQPNVENVSNAPHQIP